MGEDYFMQLAVT